MTNLREAAIKYAKLGFAVFPLEPRMKEPATDHGFLEASTNPATVEAWWIQNPDYNIGIATGEPSHLVVIDADVDKIKGKTGDQSIYDWEAVYGEMPETWEVLTGRGGFHKWYRSDGDFKCSVDILPFVDIRANGGYVVAPPSVHPNGKLYEWEVSSHPDDIPLADLSGSALELLKRKGTKKQDNGEKKTFKDYNGVIEVGHRQGALISLEGYLKSLNMSDEAIMAAVRAENDVSCDVPMTEEELQKEIFPFLKRDITPETDWRETVMPVDDISPASGLPAPESLANVLKHPPELAPELIKGVLRQGHKMIISAPSKAGKSFLLIELAWAIAEGKNWCMSECTQGKVFYINMEIDGRSFKRRVVEVYNRYGTDTDGHPSNITAWNLRGHSMPITELAPLVIEQVKGHGYVAVIIDPLYKVMSGDENSNSDVAQMSRGFDMIAQETGCSVIYAHHFSKGYAGDKASIDRGSGAGTFARDPDAILTLTQLDLDAGDRTAWRIEYVLREFPNKKPVDVWWEYPIHTYDGNLEDCEVVSQKSALAKRQKKAAMRQRSDNVNEAVKLAQKCDDNGGFTTTAFMDVYSQFEDVARNTAEARLKAAGYIKRTETKGSTGIWHKT